jgi:hypothetical protein
MRVLRASGLDKINVIKLLATTASTLTITDREAACNRREEADLKSQLWKRQRGPLTRLYVSRALVGVAYHLYAVANGRLKND